MSADTLLQRLLASTRKRVEAGRSRPLPERPPAAGTPRAGRFREALRRPDGRAPIRFLCEIKRASPSKGRLRERFDPEAIALEYARAGAAAISVLTEPEHFQGAPEHLTQARLASGRPCLRKDFVLDPFQIEEAAALGADAVLLIVAALEPEELGELLGEARARGLDALVEIHDEDELGVALEADADLIGINNRDLETFEVDPRVTEELHPLIDHGIVVVSESGISSPEDVRRMSELGVDALLVGEHFMRAASPGAALESLRREAERAVERAAS